MHRMLRRRRGRSGSILIMLVVGLMVFLAAYGMLAAGQVTHARRLQAEYGKLQALYAAESGIYAAMVANQNVAATTLVSDAMVHVSYSASFAAGGNAPGWITGVGTAVVRGDTFTATVRGYSLGTKVLMWDFGT